MKIIAQTRTDRYPSYLVEMDEYEIAKVQGESHVSRLESKPYIHQEINAGKAWDDLCSFRVAKSKIEAAAETLKACAQLAAAASAAYTVEPEPKKEASNE